MSWSVHDAVSAAKQLARRARTGPPTEDYAPRRRGRGPRVLDGQIDIYGAEHRRHPQLELDEEVEPDE